MSKGEFGLGLRRIVSIEVQSVAGTTHLGRISHTLHIALALAGSLTRG